MPPVIAIGIDAGDPDLIEHWSSRGRLPHLARLRSRGAYGRLRNLHYYRAETAWTTFLTGVGPETTGYWSPLKYRGQYTIENVGAYDFRGYPPFYALAPGRRVAVIDLPQTRLVSGVNGIQVIAWGAHSALAPSGSDPAGLLPELIARHGAHPALDHDEAPLYDRNALVELASRLLTGIRRRTAICLDLLQREPWDLFLTMFSETHSAGHYMWHLSQPDHPLYAYAHRDGENPLLAVMEAIDDGIGAIAAAAPSDATIVVYSGHGMEANSMDLPSMVFLPELLFRHSFPGRQGLTAAREDQRLPPPQRTLRRSCWEDDLYGLKADRSRLRRFFRRRLPGELFYRLERRLGWSDVPCCYRECSMLHYQPAWWYRGAWPRMQAFALPSFSEGYVRVNLAGREPQGIVRSDEYEGVCREITSMLLALRDPRSSRPLVREVVRTRRDPFVTGPSVPDPDLIVSWTAIATDVVDSPTLGRVGPVPFLRSGSHVERGFVLAAGGEVPPGVDLPPGHSLDLAPTIMSLAGAPIPAHFEGQPLITRVQAGPAVVSS